MAAEDEAAGARLNAESQQGRPGRRDPLSLASGVSEVIAASPDLKAMLEAVARRVAEALGVWECNIYEYRSETDTLVATALWAGEVTPEDHAWLGTVYPMADRPSYQQMLAERTVREYQADDPAITDRERANMQRWGERSVFSLPLVFQDEVVGALTVVEKRGPRRFTDEDLRLLELMAVPAAVAVHSARMFRREAEQKRRLEALLERQPRDVVDHRPRRPAGDHRARGARGAGHRGVRHRHLRPRHRDPDHGRARAARPPGRLGALGR